MQRKDLYVFKKAFEYKHNYKYKHKYRYKVDLMITDLGDHVCRGNIYAFKYKYKNKLNEKNTDTIH